MDFGCDIVEKLESRGFEAYFVGGCVRDSFLGLPCADIDITTSARPEHVCGLFPSAVATGDRFGTVTVCENGIRAEITTMRTESGYSDHRHPDKVIFTDDIYEDLKRRDFTVNAMAWSPRRGLIDPYDGQKDLKARLIRTVGEPEVRFAEDALRIMRGWRFCAVLGFNIEENTLAAAHRCLRLADLIEPSLVRLEAERILSSDIPETILYAVGRAPTKIKMNRLSSAVSALLLSGGVERIDRYGISRRQRDEIVSVINAAREPVIDRREMKLLLFGYGKTVVEAASQVNEYMGNGDSMKRLYEDVIAVGEPYDKTMLNIDAKKLSEQFGNRTGEVLDALTLAVINSEIRNDAESLEAYANMML